MGYNTLMLYTEDTYEVNNQPYFGHLRGRYTKDELKELDAFCNSIGIELVPCIQTLAHLNGMFRWQKEYDDINDCDDILLAEEEKTYKLIEDMISTLSECFTTRKIHIGMDEAYKIGTGKYQQKHGIKDRFDIINNHLHKVCSITRKYNFEPMVWSDMFCKLALGTQNQYEKVDFSIIKEKANLPEDISLVYWDYYHTEYDHYVNMIKTNKAFNRKVYFAGGAWTWPGFAPRNGYSIKTTDAAVKACNDCGVDGMFFTMWGDDGDECSKFAVLPSLMFAAEATRGNTDIESIKKKFKDITGCDFDSFMLLDQFNMLNGKDEQGQSKLRLYNDIFLGTKDYLCTEEDSAFYASLAEKIKNASGKGEFSYMFDVYEKYAKVLEIKSALGIRTRKAYLGKDTRALKEIICDYDTLSDRLEEFYASYKSEWFRENKPHGFDVQDIRLGGLMRRVQSCKERLANFIDGKINEIPELSEPVLEGVGYEHWGRLISANVITCSL